MAERETRSALADRLETFDRHSELVAAIILSAAALLSSYAGFQASLWDGEQAAHYSLSEQSRTDAARLDGLAGEARLLDMMLFTQWTQAFASGDRRLQEFYSRRFRPEFREAFDQWLALGPQRAGAPPSPFAMPAYAPPIEQRRRELQVRATRQFAEGQRANDIGDYFLRATVALAMSLFLGGIVQAFKILWLRVALLALAGLLCVVGLFQILVLPPLWLT